MTLPYKPGVMPVDFHTHILPAMDDGSRSPEESLSMLQESARRGVEYVVLTPHFYADREDPRKFLSRRARSYAKLAAVCTEKEPKLILGAEVAYYEGLTEMAEISEMRIGDTRAIMIEMPQRLWSERMVEDLLEIQRRPGYRVVVAHIERYAAMQDDDTLDRLVSNGIRMQANAEFFISMITRNKAIRMMRRGLIHYLGTDCHNMTTRAPRLDQAVQILEKRCGPEALQDLYALSESLLNKKAVPEKLPGVL